jgi:hypothetical protein
VTGGGAQLARAAETITGKWHFMVFLLLLARGPTGRA